MRFSRKLWNACMVMVWVVVCLPISKAASLAVSSPASILEDVGTSFSYSVQSDSPFDGSITLTPTNAQTTPTSISFSGTSFQGTHLNGTFVVTGTNPGTYSLVATLSNSTSTLDTEVASGDVNSSAPKVLAYGPSGTLTISSVLLSIRTDEISTCRYGTADAAYSSLSSAFTNTNSLSHNQSLSGLGEGTHTYYVRCTDSSSHEMNASSVIQFTIDSVPSASITLSDPSPVKAGTVEVTLKTSESLPTIPILQYSYDDSNSKKSIALSGSGSEWKGYIIVTENENNKVGAFYFSGTDSAGNTGTSITSGSIFVVDSTKPSAPSSVKSTVLPNSDVRLDWYYDGEEIDLFKIYRSTSSGVQFVDFYDDTSDNSNSNNQTRRYADTSTLEKVTYYYRISAVDKAGNEGPLSEEVYATAVYSGTALQSASTQTTQQQATTPVQDVPRVLPPNLIPLVNDQVKKIDKVMLDIDAAFTDISRVNDQKILGLITDFSIKQKMESSKSSLQDIKAQATELKNYYATKDELQSKLSKIDSDLRAIETSTIKSVEIKNEAELSQTLSKDNIITAANYILQSSPLTEEEQQRYIKLNDKNKDKISVETSVKVLDFTYMDDSRKQRSYIKKTISHSDKIALSDVVLFEFIPKSVAASASEIAFLTPNYEVVEEDPVVKFGFLNFKGEGESISYTLDKEINIDDLKESKSVVLMSLSELAAPSSGIASGITGLVVNPFKAFGMDKSESFFLLAGILTVVILAGYYLIFLDGVSALTRGARRNYQLAKLGGFGQLHKGPSSGHGAEGSVGRLQLSETEANAMLGEIYTHIDTAKKNAAEHLIPALFSLHGKIDAKRVEGLSVQELMHLANFHADKKDLAKAAALYKQINRMYPSLPKEVKSDVHKECVLLHQKLQQMR